MRMDGNHFLSEDDWINKTLRFSIEKKELQGTVKNHWHTFFEMELILQGNGYQIYNGKRYALQRGCLYFLTPTDMHEVTAQNQIQLYNLMCCSNLLPEPLLEYILCNPYRLPVYLDDETLLQISGLFELLQKKQNQIDILQPLFLKSTLHCILISCIREISHNTILQNDTGQWKASPLQKAILYLQTHFAQNPSLSQTAEVVGMNKSYFCEMFHQKTGRSYVEYLTSLKLEYAKQQLYFGSTAIKNICTSSGFSSMSNFLNAFKKETGCSPSAYRKKYSQHVG